MSATEGKVIVIVSMEAVEQYTQVCAKYCRVHAIWNFYEMLYVCLGK